MTEDYLILLNVFGLWLFIFKKKKLKVKIRQVVVVMVWRSFLFVCVQ